MSSASDTRITASILFSLVVDGQFQDVPLTLLASSLQVVPPSNDNSMLYVPDTPPDSHVMYELAHPPRSSPPLGDITVM